MGMLKAVPLVGDLWGKWYGPAFKSALQGIKKIYDAEQKKGRDLQLLEWMKKPRDNDQTPKIDKALMEFFPGGQPVLDVMYPLANGRGDAVVVPKGVAAFFMDRKSWFDKGLGKGNKLADSEGDTMKIGSWLRFNSDMAWAALYGSLPHALR